VAAIPLKDKLVHRFMRSHAYSSCFQLSFVPDCDGPGNPEKNPARTPAENPRPQSPPNSTHGAAITLPLAIRPSRATARAHGRAVPARRPRCRLRTAVRELLLVGECGGGGPSARRVPRARRRRLSDSGRVSDPQDCSTSMRARAEGCRQVRAYIATMRAEVRSVL